MTVEIHRSALKELHTFPRSVVLQAKESFAFLESGEKLSMPLSRPMPSIWPGCHELRFKDTAGNYRIVYVIVEKGIIFIPHCFRKKTQKTPFTEINLAQRRIKEFLDGR